MGRNACLSAVLVLLWSATANAGLLFYDSFTRSGELMGSTPDTGGGAYYLDTVWTSATLVKVSDGGRAYTAITSEHSGAFVNFSVRTPVTGVNYAVSPDFYMTATFNSSDLSSQYASHLGVEVGIDMKKTGGSLVREQQIGLGQSGWYGDLAADPHTVAWGSSTQFGRFSLGDYTLGNTVTLALRFEEKLMNLPTVQYYYEIFAGVVPLSGDEPIWTKIAGEANRPEGYSLDYIGLNVGGSNGGVGKAYTHSGYIDEIKIGPTWGDVKPVPAPSTLGLLGAGVAVLGLLRQKRR